MIPRPITNAMFNRGGTDEALLVAICRGRGGQPCHFWRTSTYTCGRMDVSWRPVRSRREPIRVWASLTAAGKFADHLDIKGFAVEL